MANSDIHVDHLIAITQTGIDPESEACKQIVEMLKYAVAARETMRSLDGYGYLDDTDKKNINDLLDWS